MADPRASGERSWRMALTPFLTNITQASAPFLTTFVLVHLSAPVVANLGGSSLSSQVMLLGREYYQTSFGERYLVLAPLIAHVSSATLKRILSPVPPRTWTSVLSLTGYTLAFFLVPIHFLTHRVFPADPSPPTNAFGPAELDYEFVKKAISTWPVRAGLIYAALAALTLVHLAEGSSILQRAFGIRSSKKRTRRIAAGIATVPVLSSLLVLAREPLLTFGLLEGRYRGAFMHVPLFWF